MTLVWQNVPKDQCEQLVTQVAGLMRRVEVENGVAGAPIPALTSAANLANPLNQSAAVGQAVTVAAQVTPGAVNTAALKGILVKANDTELNAGALNDACNGGTENVNLWFWVGRT
jgi:hypothetical protein